MGEVKDGAGVGELVVEVGQTQQLFFGKDFAFGLAGRDDLAESLAFVFVGALRGDREDDDRRGDSKQRKPAFAGPDEAEIAVSFHWFACYRVGFGLT